MQLKTDKDFIETEITPQADCPRCGASFSLNLGDFDNNSTNKDLVKNNQTIKCSNCDYELETEEALPILKRNAQLTSAINAAKTIFTSDVVFFIFIAKISLVWWLSKSLTELEEFAVILRFLIVIASLCWYVPLAIIINWFINYGDLETDDTEFLEVKKSLKLSCAMWVGANLLNVLVLNFGGWFNF